MTNNLKNMLAQYIAGKITEETENNIPTINNTSIANNLENYIKTQLNLQGTDTFNISNILNIEDINVIAGYTTQNGEMYYNGFIVLLDTNFNPINFFVQYESGASVNPILQLQKDENGFLYAIDKTDNKFRFVMLNNPSIKENDEYTIIMRQTYFLPDEVQDTSTVTHNFTILKKNPIASEYYFIGQLTGSDYTNTAPFWVHLIINVGNTNEWEYNIVNNYSNLNLNFEVTDCIITYEFNEGVNLIVLCGYTGSVINRKYVQISFVENQTSLTQEYDFNYTYRLDAKIISEDEAYIAVTECRGQTGEDRFWQRLKIYHKVNENYNLIYTYSSYSPNPPVNLFKSEDNSVYCIYINGLSSGTDTTIIAIVPVFIVCFDTYAVANEYQALTGLNYSDLLFFSVTKVNNIVNGYVQLPLAAIISSYYKSSENSYNTIDCLNPDYFNLRNTNGDILYSKDFLNVSRTGNICNCIGNIPNTDLNDTDINYEYIYSKSNLYMGLQSHQFTKNIYENLYLNYIYGYFFKNENTVKSNMIDNSALLMQATLEQGYNNFYISLIEVTYEDNTTEDFDLTSSIENLYTARFTCQFTPTKNVTMIKMMNTNKTITFLEIPTNLVAGKQYEFTQDIEVV